MKRTAPEFVQHESPEANSWRALKRRMGGRQARRAFLAHRREQRELAAVASAMNEEVARAMLAELHPELGVAP